MPLLRRANGLITIVKTQVHSFGRYIHRASAEATNFPGRFPTGPVISRAGSSLPPGFSRKHRYLPNRASIEVNRISPNKSNTIIYPRRTLPDLGVTLTGLPTGQIGYSRTGFLIQRIHQNAPLLHISGLSPVDMIIHFTSINNTLYFLHMEHSNSHYYTYFTYTSIGLYQDININTIYGAPVGFLWACYML